ncbi:hypothetical protein FB451DRAFT_101485 [Mycena latifolia]|nr:hypothetical protein FB451DRAFT_101485 [Mycena latifolia]
MVAIDTHDLPPPLRSMLVLLPFAGCLRTAITSVYYAEPSYVVFLFFVVRLVIVWRMFCVCSAGNPFAAFLVCTSTRWSKTQSVIEHVLCREPEFAYMQCGINMHRRIITAECKAVP